ncbi:tRNA 2'-phosphotransferase 1 [Pleurostoma richardsiae]|uniref:tRNA 2'-phosphotransferase 1 n=1 Tax=Pleurostoma richardsiae TaxID=41990 RepID=A0AA38VLK4_9PEZI|nr:tRNA 2'-phosphotransferase 1 [Pleurostoma richardsiae]
MAAAVLVPMSTISLNGGVLPPSAITQHSPRSGRSRGASIAKGKGSRGRGYSLVDDRETTVSKAVVFVLKRTVPGSDEEGSEDGKLAAGGEGWVAVDHILEHPKLASLGVTLSELRGVVASAGRTRLALRQLPDSDPEAPASYEIRRAPSAAQAKKEALQAPSPVWQQITPETEDLPEFIVHGTSYPKYHLILTSGSIKRAGGQPYLSFTPVTATEDGSESRHAGEADVSIWIHLRSAMEASPETVWRRTETGTIVTADEIPKSLWKKAVARRGDLGVLFEDGEVRKEVPVGLRGKGAKAKKGKGVLKSRGGDDGSDSASASD